MSTYLVRLAPILSSEGLVQPGQTLRVRGNTVSIQVGSRDDYFTIKDKAGLVTFMAPSQCVISCYNDDIKNLETTIKVLE